MVRWPGVIIPGSTVRGMTSSLDWMPTFASLAGYKLDAITYDGCEYSTCAATNCPLVVLTTSLGCEQCRGHERIAVHQSRPGCRYWQARSILLSQQRRTVRRFGCRASGTMEAVVDHERLGLPE